MLQSGLWPVLELECPPRVCFVLRVLLGYTISSCSRMMNLEESTVRDLLQTGAIQLCRATVGNANDCSSAGVAENILDV